MTTAPNTLSSPTAEGSQFSAAWQNTIPGRSDGSAYAVPMILNGGPGDPCIMMSPGLMALERIDRTGRRLAKRDYRPDPYMFLRSKSAAGRIGHDGVWTIGMVSTAGIFHCVDIDSCQDRWTLDLGTRLFGSIIPVIVCDIDHDGRDNYIIGLPDGTLVALDETKQGNGVVLWKKHFDYSILDVIAGNLDRDGLAELIIVTSDGMVRVLK